VFSLFLNCRSCRRLVAALLLLVLGACSGSGSDSTAPAQRTPQASPPPPSPVASRPNILLIIADDLGVGDVGVYGSALVKTPNIDRLASQGIVMTEAHSTASVCTPSRYAMQSGRYFSRYTRAEGPWIGENMLAGQPTLPAVLRDQGYVTALFGKWHQGWGYRDGGRRFRADIDWNTRLENGVLEAGFDTYFGTPFTHNEPPFVFVRDRRVVGLDPADPLVVVPAETNPGPYGWGYSTGAAAAHKARPLQEIDLQVAAEAIQFMRAHRDKPFFLELALVAPHTPQVPAGRFKGKSGAGVYGDVVAQADWIVGDIMRELDALGLSDNTLLMFTSDNGALISPQMLDRGHTSNLDWLGQKTDAWEGGLRIPFVARWPGRIPAGAEIDALFSLIDLPPTLWRAAGAAAPAALLDGVDQLPVLTGETAGPLRTELVMEASKGQALRQDDWVYIPGVGSRGITTDPTATWALHLYDLGQTNSDYDSRGELRPDAPSAQLYNLRDDPGQSRNVILQYPEIAAAMAARLKELLR